MIKNKYAIRLEKLRQKMLANNIDVYLISDKDPHQSEYIAPHWQIRTWLCGFDGSSGYLVITQRKAELYTDNRYFIQAEKQLADTPFVLRRATAGIWQEVLNGLKEVIAKNQKIGFNGSLFSQREVSLLEKQFPKASMEYSIDIIDEIWEHRPSLPKNLVFERPGIFNGKKRGQKVQAIQDIVKKQQADYLIITTLDDIAWLLNLRGSDIEYNPVFFAYLIVGEMGSILFLDEEKMSKEVRNNLENHSMEIRPYHQFEEILLSIVQNGKKILLNQTTINFRIAQSLKGQQLIWTKNLVETEKATKNSAEIEGARGAMVKDGIALCHLFVWLEKNMARNSITEFDIAQQLIHFRQQQKGYFTESFPAIVGYQSNGAIVHYRPIKGQSKQIEPHGMLLIDSGGQYLDGTTDITRTISLGQTKNVHRKHFTAVLKGHIALAMATFPQGTLGIQLDTLARSPLWNDLLDFGHGTGHGVGSFLNVHEGPQGISPRLGRASHPLLPGMITSNEPGLYVEGAYGIRIENLILCRTKAESDFGHFLEFETLTLFPFDLDLIEITLLNQREINWINNYHHRVFQTLAPHLELEIRNWLNNKCRPIELA